MTKQSILLVLGIALLAPAALVAKSNKEAYIESYKDSAVRPIPVSVVAPTVHSRWVGTTIELEFVVGPNGKPRHIVSRSRVNSDLSKKVIAAVSRWKFEPRLDANGEPVAVRAKLPVQIVPREDKSSPLYVGSWLHF